MLGNADKRAAYAWDSSLCEEVLDKIERFLKARGEYELDDSSFKASVKNEAKAEMVDAMRDFANTSVRHNKKMPDGEKLVLGLRPPKATSTGHPAPASQPSTMVENTINNYEHRLRALNRAQEGGAGKPADAFRVRFAWQVGGERPASGAELPKSKTSRKTSMVVGHKEEDKGKTAYYATAYENDTGDTGPWSPVEEGIVA
jgi:hypothetical protein